MVLISMTAELFGPKDNDLGGFRPRGRRFQSVWYVPAAGLVASAEITNMV